MVDELGGGCGLAAAAPATQLTYGMPSDDQAGSRGVRLSEGLEGAGASVPRNGQRGTNER